MNRKIELTLKVLKILNPDHSEKDFKRAKHEWWENPRVKERGGLCLTSQGFSAFVSADIKYYQIKTDKKLRIKDIRTLLDLDQHIDFPYYWNNVSQKSYIYVFDERTAVQVMLFSGNILKMVRSIRRAKQTHG